MSRLNRKKLISLDDDCWFILERNASSRMASVYIRNAIKHYDQWNQAGHTIPLVKDGQLARRFDANNINMKIIELENMLDGAVNRWNDKYVECENLKKELKKYTANQERKLTKWWHFFFVGFRK